MLQLDIITIFPKLFDSFTSEALINRAQKKKVISIHVNNLRNWTQDKHKTIDDKPYGGGVGMVLMIEPIMKAVKEIKKKFPPKTRLAKNGENTNPRLEPKTHQSWAEVSPGRKKTKVIVFSAKGKKLNQAMVRRFSKLSHIIMIAGRYEGIDERVTKYIADEEVSIGDYVLFGGEVPAMVMIEAVTRLLPGAVGKQKSIEDESFKNAEGVVKKQITRFLEYPHYTRPESIKINGKIRIVPKVLLSGDHKKIEAWRKYHAKILND